MSSERAIAQERGGPAERPVTPLRVLAVCTGNVARSPAVERLLRAALVGDDTVSVSSAGTRALVGHRIADPMADLLLARGVDPSGFASRQLEASMLADADLVITLTREHRSAAVTLYPRALRRTFTLRELAALAASVDPASIDAGASNGTAAARTAALLPLAAAQRGQAQRRAKDDDVVDPWRRSPAVYREAMRQITTALDVLAGVIRG